MLEKLYKICYSNYKNIQEFRIKIRDIKLEIKNLEITINRAIII